MPWCKPCRKHYREKWNRKGCPRCGPNAFKGEYPPEKYHLPDAEELEALSQKHEECNEEKRALTVQPT